MDRTHGIRQDVSLYVLYQVSVDFNAVSALTESGIGEKHKGRICCPVSEVSPVPAECREFP
ncbi:hypothetical protein FMM74_019435 [Lachnospiraceae bacterium MD308]|nr:hypothetical protein [Lachnospiraceae bacterium MD308]MCI8579222.1 hypothetical protein [Dorea sp.]